MFSGFKYRFAKNHVLLKMEHEEGLSRRLAAEMSSIAGNPDNSHFGRLLVSSGAARNKYAAAAAVFA